MHPETDLSKNTATDTRVRRVRNKLGASHAANPRVAVKYCPAFKVVGAERASSEVFDPHRFGGTAIRRNNLILKEVSARIVFIRTLCPARLKSSSYASF